MQRFWICAVAAALVAPSGAWELGNFSVSDAAVNAIYPDIEKSYIDIHQHPELSGHEENTSAKLAEGLRALGFEVTEHVGHLGVVGVMKNGAGPVVMLRTELDALPVLEKTGLPYASHVVVHDDQNVEVPVMHACGHDVHMSAWLGTARLLAANKSGWSGTLILIGQPAEETIGGASGMLKDGLYTRFPKPTYAVAIHDTSDLPAGEVGYTTGYTTSNADSVDITIYGKGGHGSAPHTTIDPIVIGARIVTTLQTLVARETTPGDFAVVTVGTFHAGTKNNIIPDEAKLQLTVRTMNPQHREKVLASIARVTNGIAVAAGVPADRAPMIEVSPDHVPATVNDPELMRRVAGALERALGKENVLAGEPVMASEDFSLYALEEPKPPISMFWLGAVHPEKLKQAKEKGTRLPGPHSSEFAPVPEPTIRTGVKAMSGAVLDLMKK